MLEPLKVEKKCKNPQSVHFNHILIDLKSTVLVYRGKITAKMILDPTVDDFYEKDRTTTKAVRFEEQNRRFSGRRGI